MSKCIPQSLQIIFLSLSFVNRIRKLFVMFRIPSHQSAVCTGTTILVTRMLIINLFHIIIPLTAAHKNANSHFDCLRTVCFPFCLLSCTVCGALARLKLNATWITKTKTQTENKAWGKIHSTARSGAEIASTNEELFNFPMLSALRALSPALFLSAALDSVEHDSDLNGGVHS